jgi:hypothetical protein
MFLKGLPDFDSPTLEEEIEAIAAKDKEILTQLSPLLETLNWNEKIALGQTAYFFIAISAKDPLLKLIPTRGDNSFSKPLHEAMKLLEGLSLEKLAELACNILKEDIELRGNQDDWEPTYLVESDDTITPCF